MVNLNDSLAEAQANYSLALNAAIDAIDHLLAVEDCGDVAAIAAAENAIDVAIEEECRYHERVCYNLRLAIINEDYIPPILE